MSPATSMAWAKWCRDTTTQDPCGSIQVPEELARYVARKGSICVDGVSLTVNGVSGRRFDVNLVPHTLELTILGGYQPGTRVNLEVDIIARYLERLLHEGRQ
jgi:riboflavin synthase